MTLRLSDFVERSALPALRMLALAAMCVLPTTAMAQDYPSRPITIVVGFPAGSATDNLFRSLTGVLQTSLGQPVIIDNKPGANGVVATQFVARAKPDGYTLLAGSSTTLAANVGLFKALPYDPVKDFEPVAGVGSTSMMFMVRADSPAKDLKSFLALAAKEANPMPVAYGSSSAQVALALLSKATGVKFTPVPYKGTPQAITDLLGGTIPMAIVDVGNGVPQMKAGKLTALVMSGASRSVYAPAVPTLGETYPGTELVTWIALVAPAGTPQPIVDKLWSALSAAIATADIKEKFALISTEVEPVAPKDLGRRMQRDQVRWIELIKAAGIQPE